MIPAGWIRSNVTGMQQWGCNTNGNNGTPGVQMSGITGTGNNVANEDWLITPKLDLSAMTSAYLQFDEWKRFAGNELQVLVSNDYTGAGSPSAATWLDLNIMMAPADTAIWQTYEAEITAYKSQPFHVAFRYTSTANAGYQLRVDNVVVSPTSLTVGVLSFSKTAFSFRVVGQPVSHGLSLEYNVPEEGQYDINIYDLAGRVMYHRQLNAARGTQRVMLSDLSLGSGFYTIKMSNSKAFGVTKAIIR
jgi:hypothetical protein